LRIGDDWNAIRINRTLAKQSTRPSRSWSKTHRCRAKIITITRGREQGEPYLRSKDDGAGVPRDLNGLPDFKYVQLILRLVKRRLKQTALEAGLQGNLDRSFELLDRGDTLTMTSSGADQRVYQMVMNKGDPPTS